jgi:hypothetical protein
MFKVTTLTDKKDKDKKDFFGDQAYLTPRQYSNITHIVNICNTNNVK